MKLSKRIKVNHFAACAMYTASLASLVGMLCKVYRYALVDRTITLPRVVVVAALALAIGVFEQIGEDYERRADYLKRRAEFMAAQNRAEERRHRA